MDVITHVLRALVAAAADRNRLAVENAALRQQILVLQRSVTRARLDDTDRMFWIFLRRFVLGRDVIALIKRPAKVVPAG